MPTRQNIEITRGTPFSESITVTDDDDNPIDLTDFNVTGWLQLHETGNHIPFNVDVITPESGMVSLDLPIITSSGMFLTEYMYYVNAINSGEADAFPLLRGYARVYP